MALAKLPTPFIKFNALLNLAHPFFTSFFIYIYRLLRSSNTAMTSSASKINFLEALVLRIYARIYI
jgi:hypothetical protein